MRGPEQPPLHILHIAIVAASLRILGGQAVQAQRLLEGWKGDPEIDAWLVPINPVPPPPFSALLSGFALKISDRNVSLAQLVGANNSTSTNRFHTSRATCLIRLTA